MHTEKSMYAFFDQEYEVSEVTRAANTFSISISQSVHFSV